MATAIAKEKTLWRMVVVGGHTRSIGKTQLVCDVIRAFPKTEWIAGKITQYGHGVCATNGENCDCAPTEHVCALDWETQGDTGTDSARFLAAGAKRSFWLRTKQGYLAEGLPLLRKALEEVVSGEWRVASKEEEGDQRSAIGDQESGERYQISDSRYQEEGEQKVRRTAGQQDVGTTTSSDREEHSQEWLCHSTALIVESNSLMQFVRPSLYFAVIDPLKEDFKESAQLALDRAQALVLRGEVGGGAPPAPLWMKLPAQLMKEKPSVLQREGEELPAPLWELVHRMLEEPPSTRF